MTAQLPISIVIAVIGAALIVGGVLLRRRVLKSSSTPPHELIGFLLISPIVTGAVILMAGLYGVLQASNAAA